MKRLLSLLLAAVLCVSLCASAFADEPTAESKPLVICLDPGHGARDSGAVSTYDGVEYQEADLVLKIGLYLRDELETYENVKVIMTRTDRQGEMPTIDPAKIKPRTDFATANGADVLVSLHLNASEKRDIKGVMILDSNGYYNREIALAGEALGSDILIALANLGLQNRGHLKTNSNDTRYPNGTVADYYAIVRNGILQSIPSIIVEHCFITNEEDFRNHLSSDEKLYALAMADAEGIAAYYGLQKKVSPDAPKLTDYDDHWAKDSIDAAVANGWASGYPDRTFRPENTLKRADFVTLLSRMSGETMPTVTQSPFPDFAADAYYAASVAWAVEAKIINGFEDGTFRPMEPITREQMAHIMALYLQHKGLDTKADPEGKEEIADLNKVSGWAKDDVRFCYQTGLLNGKGDGFYPLENATRAEACTILLRLWNYLNDAQNAEPAPTESPAPDESPAVEETPAPVDNPEATESPAPSDTPEETESPAPVENPEETASPAPDDGSEN